MRNLRSNFVPALIIPILSQKATENTKIFKPKCEYYVNLGKEGSSCFPSAFLDEKSGAFVSFFLIIFEKFLCSLQRILFLQQLQAENGDVGLGGEIEAVFVLRQCAETGDLFKGEALQGKEQLSAPLADIRDITGGCIST